MDTAGYVILSRLAAQQRATEALAHNLANADTPGYRAARMLFSEYVSRQSGIVGTPGGQQVAYTQDRATWRESQAGAISRTGNPLDVAIAGEGFFAVETPRGERYTRAGRFSIGAEGRLVDLEGNPVLDTQGNPIAVAATDTRLEVLGDGTLRSENGPVGRLRVVRFEDAQRLVAEGDRLLRADQPPEAMARPALVGGAVESSNVQPVLEMTRLTEETRRFQFAAQFLERESQRVNTAVDRLLRHR
ncbi:flagellar basal-body rod protein FlgF [Roseomonas sp. NAR14]|uniref:Flagellar basal-body rod protein FlgF n=1 Tax=Roseomonas acroporae TaxID=2937791 RepID=A0A9X1YIL5_9PROT|nr:flagellar basal-body rod protein FlgF [Roseomonas acroporae]MCK8786856.1 flagellar basal-body rod protein FlgF [Roseomonas acroporae]